MKAKTFTAILLSVLTVLVLASLTSASLLTASSIGSLTKNKTSATFQIYTNSTTDINVQAARLDQYIRDVEFNQIAVSLNPESTNVPINSTNPGTFTVSYLSIPEGFKFSYGGNYNIRVLVTDADGDNVTVTVPFLYTYCEYGETGNDVQIKSIKDNTDGRDDWEWEVFDDISIAVKAKNDGSDKEDIAVKLALYSEDEDEFVDLEGDDELEDSVRIADGDSEYFYFDFKLSEDLEAGDYRLYIKAFVDGEEELQCSSYEDGEYFKEVSISAPDAGFSISDIKVPNSMTCDSTEKISFRLYNFDLGDEEKFRVGIYNTELGLSLKLNPFELDEGDYADLSFNVNTSKYTAEKMYTIDLMIEHGYRESTDSYKNLNDDNIIELIVSGNCLKPLVKDAELPSVELQTDEEDVRAGEKVIIKVKVNNTGTGGTGDEKTTYSIAVDGNEEFSTVKSVSPSTLSLLQGESKDVLITLELDDDAEGEKIFDIVVTYNGKSTTQSVSLSIGEKAGIGKYLGFNWMRDHWGLMLIILVNVALVILVIVFAVKLSR